MHAELGLASLLSFLAPPKKVQEAAYKWDGSGTLRDIICTLDPARLSYSKSHG